MNIKPIHDQVVVLPDPPPSVYKGLIVMPETVIAENPNYYTVTGRVVATGTHSFERAKKGQYDFGQPIEQRPFDVQPGQRVVFNRYAGKQITCDDDRVRYLILRECEILGVLEGEHDVQPGYHEAGDTGVKALDPKAMPV